MNNNTPTLKDRLLAFDRSLLGGALIGALLGCGLTLPLHAALGFTGPLLQIPLVCAGLGLALAVISINRWTKWLGFVTVLAAAGLWVPAQVGTLQNLYPALSMLLEGHIAPLRLFSAPLTIVFCAVFTITGFTLARRNGGFYPALSLTLILLLGMWFYGDRSQITLCIPALLALMLLYAMAAEHGTTLRRIFPMALAALLLAMLLLPGQETAAKPLEDVANRVREIISDYLFFNEPRTSYSLKSEGYQSLGERLGGPAEPSDHPVMEVRSASPLLLRGTIKDSYTGLSWYDGISSVRHLYIDPRLTGLRDSTMDAKRPNADIRHGTALFAGQSVEVIMAAPGVSTLFMPQRFEDLRPNPDMVPYFNLGSEIFITRDTAPGDAYTVTAYPLMADTPGLAQLIESLRGQGTDANYESVESRYMHLPDAVEPGVYALAQEWTEGAFTPFEKAMALTRRLRAAYPYTLDQSIPPASRDFVSWFLLEERKGYCTSFASSLAVMGRLVGLPTRYVEGYTALPGGDGIAWVTGQNAHAWVEIYFEHFGWVSFDATPPQDSNHMPPQGENNQNENNDGGNEEPPPSPPPPPPNTPEPTPSAPPEQEPDENPNPEPEPDEESEPEPTPTPTPTPEPPPPGLPESEPPEPPLWLLWLLPPLLLAALVWRIYATHPVRAAGMQAQDDAKLLVWYRGLAQLLGAHGLPLDSAESPLAYFERAERALADEAARKRRGNEKKTGPRPSSASSPIPLIPVAGAVCTLRYGAHALEPMALAQASAAYQALWKLLPPHQKVTALWRRVLSGVGSIKQIP